MTSRILPLAVMALLPACTFLASYPSVGPEDTDEACADGIDNDLDGDTDCADPDCASFCPSVAVVEPTSLLPCFTDGDVTFRQAADRPEPTCEPFPASPPTCGPGEALLPGRAQCTLLGAPCGEPFKPDLAADTYVLQGQVDGDGSLESPYGLVPRGVSEGVDGGTVSVGAGAYSGHLTIDRPMHLVGACPATTLLIGGSATQPVIRVQSPGVVIEGFTLSGIGPGIVVEPGASLELRDIIIDNAGGDALHVEAASLDATHLVVRNVQRDTGAGLRAIDGADVHLSSALFEDIEGAGVVVEDATVDIHASAIDGTGAQGVRMDGDARLVGRGLMVASSAVMGFQVSCTGSSPADPCLDLEDALIRHPTAAGAGLLVESGHVHLARTLVDGSHLRGLYLVGGHTSLSHVAIVHTRRDTEESGVGVAVHGNAVLEGRHLRLRANQFHGLVVDGATATLRDLELLGPQESGTTGVGIHARNAAALDLERFAIESAGLCGIQLEADVTFTGVDGVISDTQRGACVAPDAFTPAQMSTRITYAGNGRNIVVVE